METQNFSPMTYVPENPFQRVKSSRRRVFSSGLPQPRPPKANVAGKAKHKSSSDVDRLVNGGLDSPSYPSIPGTPNIVSYEASIAQT